MKKKTSLKKKIAWVIAVALIIFIISPLSRYALSLAVMSVYSDIHERQSIMAEKGIELYIPGGRQTGEADWYPFVMTFNAGPGFGKAAGDDSLKLTILYNFGAFDLSEGCSRLYDRSSPYYSSFYGAYLVTRTENTASGNKKEDETPFGFNNEGMIDADEVASVPQYDLMKLVLGDFGISPREQVFEWTAEEVTDNAEYLGYEGWSRVDASLLVNGAAHMKRDFRQSYLQYGVPRYDVAAHEQFLPITMRGRIYGRYFEETDTSIFFYILTPEQDTLEKCDRNILSKSQLSVAK